MVAGVIDLTQPQEVAIFFNFDLLLGLIFYELAFAILLIKYLNGNGSWKDWVANPYFLWMITTGLLLMDKGLIDRETNQTVINGVKVIFEQAYFSPIFNYIVFILVIIGMVFIFLHFINLRDLAIEDKKSKE